MRASSSAAHRPSPPLPAPPPPPTPHTPAHQPPPPQALYTSSGYRELERDGWLAKLTGTTPRALLRKDL